MEEILLKKKEEKATLRDCVVYLLQHCGCLERSKSESVFCLDVAKKALFLYNLSPKSFGRSKKERKGWFDAISVRIDKYKNDERFNTLNE